jgi:hypothetical protein
MSRGSLKNSGHSRFPMRRGNGQGLGGTGVRMAGRERRLPL